MAATALYFVGDLIYANRAAIGHALSWTGHGIVELACLTEEEVASGHVAGGGSVELRPLGELETILTVRRVTLGRPGARRAHHRHS